MRIERKEKSLPGCPQGWKKMQWQPKQRLERVQALAEQEPLAFSYTGAGCPARTADLRAKK